MPSGHRRSLVPWNAPFVRTQIASKLNVQKNEGPDTCVGVRKRSSNVVQLQAHVCVVLGMATHMNKAIHAQPKKLRSTRSWHQHQIVPVFNVVTRMDQERMSHVLSRNDVMNVHNTLQSKSVPCLAKCRLWNCACWRRNGQRRYEYCNHGRRGSHCRCIGKLLLQQAPVVMSSHPCKTKEECSHAVFFLDEKDM